MHLWFAGTRVRRIHGERRILRTLSLLIGAVSIGAISNPLALAARYGAFETERGISDDLNARLAAAAPGERVPFTAVLSEQADARRLRIETGQIAFREGREAARGLAIRRLKEVAARTQPPLVAFLESARLRGEVREYQAFWIANMVSGEAVPDVIRAIAARPEIAQVISDAQVTADQQDDEVIPPEGRRYSPGRALSAVSPSLRTMGLERPEIGYNIEMVGAPAAWGLGFDGRGCIVAIIDSGMDFRHTDLADHLWRNQDEIPWNGEDDDFNGFVDDTLGWDFVSNDNDPIGTGATDHGTRVAGLVAGDGTAGIATGVAPEALLMAVRGSGGNWSAIYNSIQYACENGAHVIAMSISQKWHDQPKPDYALWRQVTDNELAVGMLHANSIGNEGDNLNIDPVPFNVATPGNCPAPWVAYDQYVAGGVSCINSVGAVDENVYVTDYSSRGPSAWEDISAHWPSYPYPMPEEYHDYPYTGSMGGLLKPDVLAPGDNCVSTMQGGGYLTMSGTSASCPHVAGALAILVQARPAITPAQAAMVLQLSAVDLGPPGKDGDYGAGLISIPAALALAESLDMHGLLTGVIRDAESGDVLLGSTASILETGDCDTVNTGGEYRLLAVSGTYHMEVSRFGYFSDTVEVSVAPSETRITDFSLSRTGRGSVSGLVLDEETGQPIPGAVVSVLHDLLPADTTAYDGVYEFAEVPADTALDFRAIHFGHLLADTTVAVTDSESVYHEFVLAHGVMDDFEVDRGWRTQDPTDTAKHGFWVRCDPVGVFDDDIPVQPENDLTLRGTRCYVTGNGTVGGGQYQNDLDGGIATLTSPIFDGTWFNAPMMRMGLWYSNDTGLFVDDTLRVELSNDAGGTWITIITTWTSTHSWVLYPFMLEDLIDLTDSMCVRIVAADRRRDSAVEVAVDEFEIVGEAFSPVAESDGGWRLSFLGPRPNPCREGSTLTFALDRTAEVRLEIFDVAGRRLATVLHEKMDPGLHEVFWDGTDQVGRALSPGAYFARVSAAGREHKKRVLILR